MKRRLRWLQLFVLACIVGYFVLMLVVAGHVMSDALARQDIDATAVLGKGEPSDAGLALAPILGIPVTVAWTTINFIVFSLIEWSYRTDFGSVFLGNTTPANAELEPSNMIVLDSGSPNQLPPQRDFSDEPDDAREPPN